jgi:hypothetical protein
VKYVNLPSLHATVALFKQLDRSKQAEEMIAQYVTAHHEQIASIDLSSYPMPIDRTDPDVVHALNAVRRSDETRGFDATLQTVAERDGWSQDEVQVLAEGSEEQYYQLFKRTRGDELHKIIQCCLRFETISLDENMKEIGKRAKASLFRIGNESRLNALRVKKYGINIP